MHDTEGSEYDRLFYPFLFEGGKANIEDVLAQVRHSTLEKCREVIAFATSNARSFWYIDCCCWRGYGKSIC